MATIHKALPLGGSGGLNFDVVGGTTEPTNPKENTIWVNTETKIEYWSLEPTEPLKEVTQSFNGAGGSAYYWTSASGTAASNNWSTNYIIVEPNTKYTITKNQATTNISIAYWTSSNGFISYQESKVSSLTFTTPSNCGKIKVWTEVSSQSAFDTLDWKLISYVSQRDDGTATQVGDVWVKTLNTNGIMSFNALKKNAIDTHISHQIYQWDGSKWVRANGTIYGANAAVEFSIAETLGLSASGACGHAVNNAVFNTYSNTFIIPEGYTKVTLNSMGINEWTYGETYGTVYLNGVSKGSKSSAYTGSGNNVGNNITIPQTWNVIEGDVIMVEIKGYTNANVSAVQNCSIWINFTLS